MEGLWAYMKLSKIKFNLKICIFLIFFQFIYNWVYIVQQGELQQNSIRRKNMWIHLLNVINILKPSSSHSEISMISPLSDLFIKLNLFTENYWWAVTSKLRIYCRGCIYTKTPFPSFIILWTYPDHFPQHQFWAIDFR